ncbi:MAG: galactose 1-dehydrogenase [Alphaproteobacteria bacterium PA4]|nr:MAG: galactose 1-dehydrogenase [Alphaproteobacteria bacterium PA4]
MTKLRLALIGIGKIARDQHLPAIAASPDFTLAAAVSRNATVEGVPNFADIDALIASGLAIDAVSICTPPLGRHGIAARALAAGWHVMLEKPPGATLAEVQALRPGTRTLYASWHSRAAAGVAPARAWLAERRIRSARIDWREDIRHWHPGQDWILAPGGLGVFDPGINALSIATAILPQPLFVTAAQLDFPANRGAPIAAALTLAQGDSVVTAGFDFLQAGPQSWDIAVETDTGSLLLRDGGATLVIDGVGQALAETGEYPGLYRHFAACIAAGRSDVDLAPLALVADAFLIGARREVAAFEF